MSDVQHTPGPWNAAPTGPVMAEKYSQSWAIVQWPHPNLVAGVFSDVRGGEAVAEANARLIAAAHELLEALEGVLSAAEHAYHTAAFADPDGGVWWERIKKDRAATAKATGAD